MKWAAASGGAVTTRLKETLALMGKGNPDDPLLIYCHHASCSYSYHAASHAVDAGYRNVFWLRDGMRGWENDGYAFAGEENQDLAGRFNRRLAACNRNLRSNQELIEIMASYKPGEYEALYAEGVKSYRELVRSCLRAVDTDFSADKARKAEVAREIARADSIITKTLPNARAALESDARIYLTPLFDKVPLDKINAYVSSARSLKSVDASCPPPSYQLPRTSAQASSTRAELQSYASCMNKLKDGLAQRYSVDALESVINLVTFTQPYVCGRNRSPNCLPEATWREVASAVSADKLQAVAQGEEKRTEMLKQMLAAQVRLNSFTPLFVQAETLLDTREQNTGQADSADDDAEEQASNQSNKSGYVYTPPEPSQPSQPAYRTPSDVSAPGVR